MRSSDRSRHRRISARSRAAAVLAGALAVVAVGVGAAFGSPLVSPPSSTVATVKFSTSSATRVLDSIGINIHENYVDTTYAPGGDTTALIASIRASGVRWVRIGLKKHPFAYEASFLDSVRASGVKVLGIIGAPSSRFDDFQTGESALLIDALKTGVYAGRVDMLELPNETNTPGASSWVPRLRQFDAEYYAALNRDPMTRSIPVVGPSVSALDDCRLIGGLAADQDYFNTHPYSGTDIPEAPVAARCRDLGRQGGLPLKQPVMATEFGWTNDLGDRHQGVTEATAANYLVRSYLWNVTHGISKSFAYELFDQRPDPQFSDPQLHFGLVRVTGEPTRPRTWEQTPKPAYRALQRLTSALERGNGKPSETALRLSAVSASHTEDLHVVQLTHRDGSVSVAIWLAERASSKRTTQVSLTVPHAHRADAVAVTSGARRSIAVSSGTLTVRASAALQILHFSSR